MLDYMAEVRRAYPTTREQPGLEARHYMVQLKHISLSAAEIVQHALQGLHHIAGYLKLCEAKMQSVEVELEDSHDDSIFDGSDAINQLLLDVDHFVMQIQEELGAFML